MEAIYGFITAMGAICGFIAATVGAHTFFLPGSQNFYRRPCFWDIRLEKVTSHWIFYKAATSALPFFLFYF